MAKLYGISVGIGDSEDISLKAVRIMNKVDIIAFAGIDITKNLAYKIALGAEKNIETKEKLAIYMPMIKEKEKLKEAHEQGANLIEEKLKEGKNVGFLVLGDASIYSTYYYLHEIIKKRGYEAEIISGISSFCAVAAKLSIDLVSNSKSLHIIPANYGIDKAFKYDGTKVFMKLGTDMTKYKSMLKNKKFILIENCNLENERIYTDFEELPDKISYFSLMIIKD